MKHFKKQDNSIHAFEDDGSQDFLITEDMIPVSNEELSILRTPSIVIPTVVDMAQARLALLHAGILPQVKIALDAMTGDEGEAARIEWEYRTTVSRNSPLVVALSANLNLDSATLDQLFLAASVL